MRVREEAGREMEEMENTGGGEKQNKNIVSTDSKAKNLKKKLQLLLNTV